MFQQGQVFKLKARCADGEPLWAYRYRVAGRGSARLQVGSRHKKLNRQSVVWLEAKSGDKLLLSTKAYSRCRRRVGFVTATTWRMLSAESRVYRARTVASETPRRAAIRRNGSRPFPWSSSMIPWSSASIRRGALTGPRRRSRLDAG